MCETNEPLVDEAGVIDAALLLRDSEGKRADRSTLYGGSLVLEGADVKARSAHVYEVCAACSGFLRTSKAVKRTSSETESRLETIDEERAVLILQLLMRAVLLLRSTGRHRCDALTRRALHGFSEELSVDDGSGLVSHLAALGRSTASIAPVPVMKDRTRQRTRQGAPPVLHLCAVVQRQALILKRTSRTLDVHASQESELAAFILRKTCASRQKAQTYAAEPRVGRTRDVRRTKVLCASQHVIHPSDRHDNTACSRRPTASVALRRLVFLAGLGARRGTLRGG